MPMFCEQFHAADLPALNILQNTGLLLE